MPWLKESSIFLKLFISEDPDYYSSVSKEWGNIIVNTTKLNFKNAWYRHILSDMHIHRGLIRLKFNENFSAGTDIQSAYRCLKDNRKMFPSFLPDNKNYGLLSCAFSSVPFKYQWLAKLIGLQGDMTTGIEEIKAYLNSDLNYKDHGLIKMEAAFIYAMVQHHLNKNSEEAWAVIEPYTRNYKTHMLANYMRATIAGYNGLNDEMIQILKDKPPYQASYPFYYMDFLLGLAKMRRLDADADIHFKIFVVKYKGKLYLKSAYKNLSWLAQSRGENENALTYYSLCRKNGTAVIEEDKLAEREAEENLPWPKSLIKARMIYDGKYFDLSLKYLAAVKNEELTHIRFKLEYVYRKARNYHDLKKHDEAIRHYLKTIDLGKKEHYYFAAYSALQIGFIYEKMGKKEEARIYFKKAKDGFPENREFSNSIEQKAKAGLKRLED